MRDTPFSVSDAEAMADEIRQADPERRVQFQVEFGQVLHDLELSGQEVPSRLRNLHEQLLEEAIESRFDNLPI